MERFKTSNGIEMLRCNLLNWAISNKYVEGYKGVNPEVYYINIGSIDEMWSCMVYLDTNILSIANVSYSSEEVFRFKIDDLEQATDIVYRFAEGMNKLDSLKDTIYLS